MDTENKNEEYNKWIETPESMWPGQYNKINTVHVRLKKDILEREGVAASGNFLELIENTNLYNKLSNVTAKDYNEKITDVIETLNEMANMVKDEQYQEVFLECFGKKNYSLKIDGKNMESSQKEALNLISTATTYFPKAKAIRLSRVENEESKSVDIYVSIGYNK